MPSYNVPSTQNTALVLEFRCLYTHDILKKQKKWHDGSLKFHTFNRRVMVYDDVKNYIGYLHYRQAEEFGEGLELQLDRPVMVEVGEPIGQSSTDLRPILDRGRGERDSTMEDAVSERTVTRANFSNTNGKAKSLLEVLGPSQGRLGRAKTIYQSPYEQRAALVQIAQGLPPAKRAKIATGKENTPTSPIQVQRDNSHNNTMAREEQRPQPRIAVSELNQKPVRPVVVDLSSDEDILARPISANKNARISSTRRQIGIQSSNGTHAHQTFATSMAANDTSTSKRGKRLGKKTTKARKSAEKSFKSHEHNGSNTKSRTDTSSMGDLGPSDTTTLKMQAQPTRLKLIYSALLPASVRSHLTGPSSLRDPVTILSPRHADRTVKCKSGSELITNSAGCARDVDSIAVQNAVDYDPSSADNDGFQSGLEERVSEIDQNRHQFTPLFCTQSASQTSLPSPRVRDQDEEIDPLFSNSFADDQPPALPAQDVSNQVLIISSSEPDRDDIFSEDEQSVQMAVHRILTPAKSVSISPVSTPTNSPVHYDKVSVASPHTGPPDLSPMSRISPELAAIIDSPSSPISNPQDLNSPTQSSELGAVQTRINPSQVEQHVRTNLHDSTEEAQCNAGTVHLKPAAVIPEEAKAQQDTGAWSNLEAFLLFEKWPDAKAKDKPTYNQKPSIPITYTTNPTNPEAETHETNLEHTNDQNVLSIDTDNTTTKTKMPKPKTLLSGGGMGLLNRKAKPLSRVLPGIRSARSIMHDK